MNISPVDSVRIAPMVRPKDASLGVTDVYQTERTARSRDEHTPPPAAKVATGFEDENDEYEDLEEEDSEAERKVQPPAQGNVNYFA